MIKLVASDMDGTLLDSNKNINPEFYNVLEDIKSRNMRFVAISGRDLQSLKNVFSNVEDDIVLASNNGNLISYRNEILYENYIEKEKLLKVIPIIRKNAKHFTIYCSKDKIYSESILPSLISRKWKLKINFVKDITKVDDNILKVTTFGNQNMINKAFKAVSILEDECMITLSGKTCFDICRLNGTKKQAIEILQKKFNINYNETMVFGDHMNDLEMMESAYYSYAMENAKKEVKERARFIAKTNDENGVVEAIKEVALRNKQEALSTNA